MRATLSEILTEDFYARNIPLASRFNEGVQSVINEFDLPWNTTQLGCRTEYWFRKEPAKNGGEAEAAVDFELDQYMHLASLNRGILMTPFHNMALITAVTTEADIDKHTAVFREIVQNIID
jgi:glutamate-1-semialdehyde 2,1-aminomutase